jgi:uncharacterized Zn-binding protein involved in type VI secretion
MPAARSRDTTAHGGKLLPGPASPNVFIGGKPAWRAKADVHICPLATPNPHGPGIVNHGSRTVYINNLPAARVGDLVEEVTGGPVPIVTGEFTVLIGD